MTIRAALLTDRSEGRPLVNYGSSFREQLMGRLAHRFPRFPLLLKYLDAT